MRNDEMVYWYFVLYILFIIFDEISPYIIVYGAILLDAIWNNRSTTPWIKTCSLVFFWCFLYTSKSSRNGLKLFTQFEYKHMHVIVLMKDQGNCLKVSLERQNEHVANVHIDVIYSLAKKVSFVSSLSWIHESFGHSKPCKPIRKNRC